MRMHIFQNVLIPPFPVSDVRASIRCTGLRALDWSTPIRTALQRKPSPIFLMWQLQRLRLHATLVGTQTPSTNSRTHLGRSKRFCPPLVSLRHPRPGRPILFRVIIPGIITANGSNAGNVCAWRLNEQCSRLNSILNSTHILVVFYLAPQTLAKPLNIRYVLPRICAWIKEGSSYELSDCSPTLSLDIQRPLMRLLYLSR